MATTTEKGSKKKNAKPRRPVVKSPPAKQAQTIAELRQELAECLQRENAAAIEIERLRRGSQDRDRDLTEALYQQIVTAEVLGLIASSPTDLERVLKTITEQAARVCGAEDAVMRLVEGNVMRLAAHYGPVHDVAVERRVNRESPPGRAVIDREIIHIENMALVAATEFPEVIETNRRVGAKTLLAVPLMREGIVLGVIHFRRLEVRPFSERQVALIKTFADQAVIAIENARLFQELKESLEQQTATSEILGVIASSPTEIQPVMDTIAKNAAKVCGANDAVIRRVERNVLRTAAHYGPVPDVAAERPIDR